MAATASVAAALWAFVLPPTAVPARSDTVGVDSSTFPLTPDLYGSLSQEMDVPGSGTARLVEPVGGPTALAVILGTNSTDLAAWASLQAMLERGDVASITALMPKDSANTRLLLTWVERQRIEREQPVTIVVPASLLDRFLLNVAGRGGRNLMVIGVTSPSRSLIASTLARLPRPIRPAPDTLDPRLVRWEAAAVVVRAEGDRAVARRLASGARRGRVHMVQGEAIKPPSLHPDPEQWRDVIATIQGRLTPPRGPIVIRDSSALNSEPTVRP